MSDVVDSNVLNSNNKSLEIYSKSLDEYHKLIIELIEKEGQVSDVLTRQYLLCLIKIDHISKNSVLKDLYSIFGL